MGWGLLFLDTLRRSIGCGSDSRGTDTFHWRLIAECLLMRLEGAIEAKGNADAGAERRRGDTPHVGSKRKVYVPEGLP
jgi:hypothetical protein